MFQGTLIVLLIGLSIAMILLLERASNGIVKLIDRLWEWVKGE
jgi:hypothetical protein